MEQWDDDFDNDAEPSCELFLASVIGCKQWSAINATDALGTWTGTYNNNNRGLLATMPNPANPVHLNVTYDADDRPTTVSDAQFVVTTRTFDFWAGS